MMPEAAGFTQLTTSFKTVQLISFFAVFADLADMWNDVVAF